MCCFLNERLVQGKLCFTFTLCPDFVISVISTMWISPNALSSVLISPELCFQVSDDAQFATGDCQHLRPNPASWSSGLAPRPVCPRRLLRVLRVTCHWVTMSQLPHRLVQMTAATTCPSSSRLHPGSLCNPHCPSLMAEPQLVGVEVWEAPQSPANGAAAPRPCPGGWLGAPPRTAAGHFPRGCLPC